MDYAQKRLHEALEQIKKMEEKMKNFDQIYQFYEANYVGGASSELSSKILVKIFNYFLIFFIFLVDFKEKYSK